ncbi:MAG: hypothetical protein B9J98_03515 [Candidatus Terraquivivens tikiterensis]|uniref:Uncharacterized protein n=1 Tax=Candidatus Terraquivivens tikiterensis TaxID=1980982 RepID=A0A2R7Y610_9ARCH|nr:MAG: hypothetical protein B9J98_03515 [Candidatus Terraquivivens tikiterensis]
MVAEDTKAEGEVEIPGDVALLPFEEKARLIVELRRQGKSYREIQRALKVSPRDVKRALKLEVHRDEIEELKSKVSRLEDKLLSLEKSLKELRNFKKEFSELKLWLELGLNRRFRKDLKSEHCVHMLDGFCERYAWKEPYEGWSMKKTKKGYVLNVDKHRWMCALCPSFMSRRSMDRLKETDRLIEETIRVLEAIPARR